ncbi:Uncharacterised protein [uncultured Eubacterium sp.]|nr:Uncharacterised protein [uncultured Eubacterium sp.]
MMDRKDIYELLELYGNGGIPGNEARKELYNDLNLSRVDRILKDYNSLYRISEKTEKGKSYPPLFL